MKKEEKVRKVYVAPVIVARPLAQLVRAEPGSYRDYEAELARPE